MSKKILLLCCVIGILAGYSVWHFVLNTNANKVVSPIVQEEIPTTAPQEDSVVGAITNTPETVEVGKPITLTIPEINVEAKIEDVFKEDDGRMGVPKEDMNVGWFAPGVKPGRPGNAVLAGHLDTRDGKPAVFYDLTKLSIGDEVLVTDDKGKTLTFVVVNKEKYADATFPIGLVFGADNKSKLNLITCQGEFDTASKNYSDRYVVFTELKE